VPQLLDRPRDGQLPRPHSFQEMLNILFVHFSKRGRTISSLRRRSTILAGILPDPP
jgi:hypothetical protein